MKYPPFFLLLFIVLILPTQCSSQSAALALGGTERQNDGTEVGMEVEASLTPRFRTRSKPRFKRGQLRERAMQVWRSRRLQEEAQGVSSRLASVNSGLDINIHDNEDGIPIALMTDGNDVQDSQVFDNIDDLQNAIDNAQDGDVLILRDNSDTDLNQYTDASIVVGCHGVTIISENSGNVILTGSVNVEVRGHNNSLSGFRFRGGLTSNGQKSVISITGDDNYIEEMDFVDYDAPHYITLVAGGQYNEVAFNNFEHKPIYSERGALVLVQVSGSRPGIHIIHSNSFRDIPGSKANFGNIPIQLGSGIGNAANLLDSTSVESNWFNNTGWGDAQVISVQSTGNIIRFNTFENNQDAMLTFRSGHNNIADSNFFMKAGGIRLVQANNIWYMSTQSHIQNTDT